MNTRRAGDKRTAGANMIVRGRKLASEVSSALPATTANSSAGSSSTVSAVTMAGDVVGPSGSNYVQDITRLRATTHAAIGYAAGGSVQIRFELGTSEHLPLVIAASFSPAGSTGKAIGARQELILYNVSGAPLSLTFNASWNVAGQALPTQLATGEAARMILSCKGTTEADVYITFIRNITVATIGTYLPLTGSLHARLRKSIAGTIASSSDMKWTRNPWFSIEDAGGIVNSSAGTDPSTNVAAFAACLAAGLATGCPFTIYVPDGDWYLDDQVNLIPAVESVRMCIRGNGRHSSRLIMLTAGKIILNINLSNGNSSSVKSHAEVYDLGFASSGVDPQAAISLSYGSGSINPRFNQGSAIRNIHVDGIVGDEVHGFVHGVILENVWGGVFSDLQLYGAAGWDVDTAHPGAGSSGGGSGMAIAIYGGTNNLFSNVYTQTWSQVIGLRPFTSGGFPGGLSPQGVFFTNLNNVNCIEFMHGYAAGGTAGCDSVTVCGFQCDNGNNTKSNRYAFYMEGGTFGMRLNVSNGLYLSAGGKGFVKLDGFGSSQFSNVQFSESLGLTSYAIELLNVSNSSTFDCCTFGNNPMYFGALAGFNQVNNTAGSAITNLGGFNVTSTNIF